MKENPTNKINRSHLPGLLLANETLQHLPWFEQEKLDLLISQASAAPEQEPFGYMRPEGVELVQRGDYGSVHHKVDGYHTIPVYTRADPSEVERLRAELKAWMNAEAEKGIELVQLRQKLADSHSAAGSLQDLCRFLAAIYCELDELRYTTAKLPADQISDFLIGKWPVIQGTANQMNIKRISGQPYHQVGALQGIIAMLATAQPADGATKPC